MFFCVRAAPGDVARLVRNVARIDLGGAFAGASGALAVLNVAQFNLDGAFAGASGAFADRVDVGGGFR